MRAKKLSPRKVATMSIPTPEAFKSKAAQIRKFLKERYNVEVSHGHSLELISQLYGHKDWNTASAASKPKAKPSPVEVKTIGQLKTALEQFKDTDRVDAFYDFKLSELLDGIDEPYSPEDSIHQEFSFTLVNTDEFVSLKLKLENEDLTIE